MPCSVDNRIYKPISVTDGQRNGTTGRVSRVTCRLSHTAPLQCSVLFCFVLFSTQRNRHASLRVLSTEHSACTEQRNHRVRRAQNIVPALSTEHNTCTEHTILQQCPEQKQTNKKTNKHENKRQTNKRQTNKQNVTAKNSLRALRKELIACTENIAPQCLL